ncbi:MAG: hypothetical protein WDZ38_05615 [Balneolaceae bacterium]
MISDLRMSNVDLRSERVEGKGRKSKWSEEKMISDLRMSNVDFANAYKR